MLGYLSLVSILIAVCQPAGYSVLGTDIESLLYHLSVAKTVVSAECFFDCARLYPALPEDL